MKKMIKNLFVTLLFSIIGLSACGQNNVTPVVDNDELVLAVSLDQSGTVEMKVGDSIQVTPTISFKDNKEVEVSKVWSSSKTTVATVANGLVTAVGVGESSISFRAGYQMALFNVKVTNGGVTPPDPEPPTPGEFSISVSPTSKTIKEDESFKLTVSMSNAPEGTVVAFSSNDNEVASVDSEGLVKGLKEGSAVITASANNKSATCNVTVTAKGGSGGEEDEFDCEIYFFIDYNNIDENDTTGKKLLAHFEWYSDRPISESGKVPSDPSEALDPAFPYFIGWSSHTIIDSKEDLWDMEKDTVGNAYFIFLYGIWSDVPKGSFNA